MRKVTIGSRESKLAVIQTMLVADYIKEFCKDVEVSVLTMKTTGDKILDRTLDQVGGKGLFVKELDKALLDGRSDISVHSLKDMPMEVQKELPLIGFSHREDPRDVLVLPKGKTTIEPGKPIGSSGKRRIVQLSSLFPGVPVKSVRGNVITRLEKLDSGEYGALILAAAGLKRLGLEDRISRYFTVEEMIPAAGQGVLAIQGKEGEDYSFLAGFLSEESKWTSLCERSFVSALDGGCSAPIGAYAKIEEDQIELKGLYAVEDGSIVVTGSAKGPKNKAEKIGEQLAKELRQRGQSL